MQLDILHAPLSSFQYGPSPYTKTTGVCLRAALRQCDGFPRLFGDNQAKSVEEIWEIDFAYLPLKL